SAAHTLLFPVDALLHADRCARILAQDFAERRAGGFLLTERRERLTEPQQRVRRLGGGFVFGRHVEEALGGVAVALTLEQALPQPVLCLRRHPIVGIALEETAEAILGERVVAAQDVAVGEIVAVLRAVGGRQRRDLRTSAVRTARRSARIGLAGRA